MTSGLVVSVYQPDGSTLIANVPRRKNVQWLDELNTAGTGQFEIHLDDPLLAAQPTLLAPYNIVKFSYLGTFVKAWQIEDISQTFTSQGERADRWVTVTGRGLLSLLESAVVYPEYGLRAYSSEDRHFNFTSKDGPWRIPSEWSAPLGVKQSLDRSARRSSPRGWPDPDAYWIWSTDPTVGAAPGRNWFRGTFNVTVTTDLIIFATADNSMELFLDGEQVLATPVENAFVWRQLFQIIVRCEPGEHTVAAWVDNWQDTAFNPAGFICSIWTTNTKGQPVNNVMRSTTSSFIVKSYGKTPGWHAATIIKALVQEAQARQVAPIQPITFGFTDTLDSNGVIWVDVQGGDQDNNNMEFTPQGVQIQDRTFKVGTSDLLDVLQQLIELTMDVDITPDFIMKAWRKRGIDRSATVRIQPFVDATQSESTTRSGKVRNQILVHSQYGWIEAFNATSKTKYGRREGGLSVGNAESIEQSSLVGAAALREVAGPDVTIPLSYTSAIGPQPYVSYNLGDTISVPGNTGTLVAARVMSVSANEVENVIEWDIDAYPVTVEDVVTVSVPKSTTAAAKEYPIMPMLPVDPTVIGPK